MRRIFTLIITLFHFSCGLTAQERTDSAVADPGGPLVVSLLTCAPGPDVYELCGHSAIRIRNAVMDSVWNYGVFDFDTPNFVYRFCKGQTDYMVMGTPIEYFMPIYIRRGSQVTEQVLDLTQEEARTLRKMLQTESLPQNRTYRYNYVKDNCATRPWERIRQTLVSDSAADRGNIEALLPDTLFFPTYRAEMRHFHRNYPWYQFGIDLALGSGLDYPLHKDEDIFAPPVLAGKLAGTPLVVQTNVLYPGIEDATLAPTPWYLTPMAIFTAVFLISVAALILYLRKKICWKWLVSAYFILLGIAGCIITFLVFVSEHEATSPNMLIFFFNPLQLVVGIGIWFKSWRKPVRWIAAYDLIVAIRLGVSVAIQMITQNPSPRLQAMNPAMLPLFASGAILSILIFMVTRKSSTSQHKKVNQ